MDFAWSGELENLRREAVNVAQRAAADVEVREDSWINGYSREFSRELAERGRLGTTWPKEEGGNGRSPLERFVVVEALIADDGSPIAASWTVDRQFGPSLLAYLPRKKSVPVGSWR